MLKSPVHSGLITLALHPIDEEGVSGQQVSGVQEQHRGGREGWSPHTKERQEMRVEKFKYPTGVRSGLEIKKNTEAAKKIWRPKNPGMRTKHQSSSFSNV